MKRKRIRFLDNPIDVKGKLYFKISEYDYYTDRLLGESEWVDDCNWSDVSNQLLNDFNGLGING